MFSDTYKMITAPAEILYKSKGSKFFTYCFPVKNEQEIKSHLHTLKEKYPDATHHCYAWVLGYDKQNFRANDDGEPTGTAGKPILRQIHKFDLCNVLVVVVRYFGGTMLGVPGLIEAYGQSTSECLQKTEIQEHQIYELYTIKCPYGMENEVYRISRQFQVSISVMNIQECFSAEIKIPLHKVAAFKGQLVHLYQINIEYKGIE